MALAPIEPALGLLELESIAAGIEALKDAHIPLVLQHKLTSTGNRIPNGYALPEEMQATTGVIMTSLFPGFETLIEQLVGFRPLERVAGRLEGYGTGFG